MSQEAQPSHVIRIHGTWFRTELTRGGVVLETRRVSLPDALEPHPHAVTLVFVRNFNLPTGLSSGDEIELECELLPRAQLATINQVELTAPRNSIVPITQWLKRHNELVIHLSIADSEIVKSSSARLRIFSS